MESFLDFHDENEIKLFTEVAHKIKNSLGGIGGFASLLERDLGPDDSRTALVKRIQSGVIRMNEVLVSFMSLFKTPELFFDRVNPVPVIQHAWNEFWEDADPPENVLELPDPKTSIEIIIDLESFQQLVLHSFRFVQCLESRIDRIQLTRKADASIRFDVIFQESFNLQVESLGNGMQKIQTCEPLEAKISLYIVIKMAKLNGAKISFAAQTHHQSVLSVQFTKGIDS